jgi:glutamyl-tRNA(Gln) amidotransferase subunit E
LYKIVDSTIGHNRRLIEERGANAFGSPMGMVMKEVRGKANAALVSELVKEKLQQAEKK